MYQKSSLTFDCWSLLSIRPPPLLQCYIAVYEERYKVSIFLLYFCWMLKSSSVIPKFLSSIWWYRCNVQFILCSVCISALSKYIIILICERQYLQEHLFYSFGSQPILLHVVISLKAASIVKDRVLY